MLDDFGGHSQMGRPGGYAYEEEYEDHEEYEEQDQFHVAQHESHGGYFDSHGGHQHRPHHHLHVGHHGSRGGYMNGHGNQRHHNYESSEEEEEEVMENHQHYMMKQRSSHPPPPLHYMPPPPPPMQFMPPTPMAPSRNHVSGGFYGRREEPHLHNMHMAPHHIPTRNGYRNTVHGGYPMKPAPMAAAGKGRIGGQGGGYMRGGYMTKALD